MGIDVNRERAIDLALSQIEKQFGKGAIMRLGEAALTQDVACLPTGSLGLDIALGIGGIPRGRGVEIYGPESSGQTTLALQLIAEGQKRGGICAFINQIRMRIGILFGNPETTTGGNALKFYASVRLDIRRLGAIKHGDEVIGSRTKVKVVKNKVAPPFREAEFDILYGSGISKEGELIDIASEQGIVEKTGAWYAFGGDRIGQGRENARDFLREHPEVAAQIEARVREKFGLRSGAAEGGNGASAEGVRAAEAARRGRGGKE